MGRSPPKVDGPPAIFLTGDTLRNIAANHVAEMPLDDELQAFVTGVLPGAHRVVAPGDYPRGSSGRLHVSREEGSTVPRVGRCDRGGPPGFDT